MFNKARPIKLIGRPRVALFTVALFAAFAAVAVPGTGRVLQADHGAEESHDSTLSAHGEASHSDVFSAHGDASHLGHLLGTRRRLTLRRLLRARRRFPPGHLLNTRRRVSLRCLLHPRGYVNRCVNDIRRRPSQPLIQWRFHPHTVHRDRVLCLPIDTKKYGSHGQSIWMHLGLSRLQRAAEATDLPS